MNYDVITIRMSRSSAAIPWGFSIQPPRVVRNVEGGGLADRAGLQNGDLVEELQQERNLSYERTQDLMQSAKNELEIIVMREPMVTRIWQPSIVESSIPDRLTAQPQRSAFAPSSTPNYQVSFQHQPLQPDRVHGFNQAPRQFGANSQPPKFDAQSPAYLRSEALKLIQEDETRAPPANTGAAPECFCCGRMIIGLMTQAADKKMHPNCFECSTCGANLAQGGHHFINDKFYCTVHGNQRRSQPAANGNESRRPEAPLTQSVRPFSSNGNANGNQERSNGSSVRFNQQPTAGNTIYNPPPTIPLNGSPSTRPFGAPIGGRQNAHKSIVFRRRKLKRPWPPPPGRLQRNADAQRFWKYTYDGDASEGLATKTLKSLIEDFECGRKAEEANTIRRRPPADHPLARRVVSTPDRLSAPMRKNPFGWNAEPPSASQSSRTSSSLNLMPSSSTATLTPGGGVNGEEVDADDEELMHESMTTPEPLTESAATYFDGDDQEATNWKYRAEIVEERDILTASSTSSPGTSLSPAAEVDGNQTSTFVFEQSQTEVKAEKRKPPLAPPKPLVVSNPPPVPPILSPIDEEEADESEEPSIQSTIPPNEQLNARSPSPGVAISHSHVRPFARGFSTVQLAERPVQIVSSSIQSTAMPTQEHEEKPIVSQEPAVSNDRPERPRIRVQTSTAVQPFKKQPTVSSPSTSKKSKRAKKNKQEAAPKRAEEVHQLDELLAALQLEADWLNSAADELTKKKAADSTVLPPQRSAAEVAHEEEFVCRREEAEVFAQAETTFSMAALVHVGSLVDVRKTQKNASTYVNFNSTLPACSHRHDESSLFPTAGRFSTLPLSLNRWDSTDESVELPPPMPRLHLTPSPFPNYASAPRMSTPVYLQDCLIRTSSFLSFLNRLDILNERIHPKHTQTLELLRKAEQTVGEPDDLERWAAKLSSRKQGSMTASYNSTPNSGGPPPPPPPSFQPPTKPTGEQAGHLLNHTGRVPHCEQCHKEINGSFVLATGKTWCQEHFTCANPACNRRLLDCGFVEEDGKKFCEKCFETLLAPSCAACGLSITADCLNALQKQWHPECFLCAHCRRPFGNTAFYLENGQPYCEKDWNQLFTTKCVSCKFPIEAGDRWIEAMGSAFHSNCFNCQSCNVNLEGQNFYSRDGRPFCRAHV